MKFVLLFCGTRELQQAWIDLTEEARSAQYAEVGRWFAENGARLGPGNQLQPPFTATTVRFHLFHAIRGELLLELSQREQARAASLRALALTHNPAEQSLLARRLLEW
jgi:hypothetical protein